MTRKEVISLEKPRLPVESRLHLLEIGFEAMKRQLDRIERQLRRDEA